MFTIIASLREQLIIKSYLKICEKRLIDIAQIRKQIPTLTGQLSKLNINTCLIWHWSNKPTFIKVENLVLMSQRLECLIVCLVGLNFTLMSILKGQAKDGIKKTIRLM